MSKTFSQQILSEKLLQVVIGEDERVILVIY